MSVHCPACKRPILNRAIAKCVYCGGGLPQDALFTEEELKERENEYKSLNIIRKDREKRRTQPHSTNGNGQDGVGFDGFDFGGHDGGLF